VPAGTLTLWGMFPRLKPWAETWRPFRDSDIVRGVATVETGGLDMASVAGRVVWGVQHGQQLGFRAQWSAAGGCGPPRRSETIQIILRRRTLTAAASGKRPLPINSKVEGSGEMSWTAVPDARFPMPSTSGM
jgi:hypothetical protein